MKSKRFYSLPLMMLMFYVFMVMVINASDKMKSKEEEEGINLLKRKQINKTKKEEVPILKSHYEEIRPRLIWAVENINDPVGFSMDLKKIILKYLGALEFTLFPMQPFPIAIGSDYQCNAKIFHDGQFLFSLSINRQSLYLSDLTNQLKTVRTFSIPKPNPDPHNIIYSYAIAKNRSLIIEGANGLIYLWHTLTGDLITTLKGHTLCPVLHCGFFLKDTRIATGNINGFRVWRTGKNQYNCLRVKPVNCLKNLNVSAENAIIIYTTFLNQKIQIYDSTTDQNIRVLHGHSNSSPQIKANITAIDNDQIFGSIVYGGEIKLWNTSTGECTKTIPSPEVYPDIPRIRYISSKWLVWSGYWQGAYRVRVWNLEKDTYIDVQGGEYISFVDVRYDKDLIIASYIYENLQMQIYSLETGKLMKESKK